MGPDIHNILTQDVDTWDSLFSCLREARKGYMACGCTAHAMVNHILTTAFVLAMEELPEAGDVTDIVGHMANTILNRPEDTGFYVKHTGDILNIRGYGLGSAQTTEAEECGEEQELFMVDGGESLH